jgi:serine/threonine protein kinase
VVAVKRIDYKKWKVHNNGVSKQQLEAEFNIHAKLEHPNVVRMYSVFKGTRWIYVVLEMVLGGDLFDYLIQKAQHGVEEKVARRWFAQLLDGVDYCHKQNVVHRDLKPENILLSHSSHDATLKIADFGLSKALQGNNVCRTNCGTPQYMAPEVHLENKNGYGKEADLWGLGVILHVMLTVSMPFGDDENSQQLQQDMRAHVASDEKSSLLRGAVWDRQSVQVKSLIRGLLTADAKKRTTVEGARVDDWMVMPPTATAGGSPAKKRRF